MKRAIPYSISCLLLVMGLLLSSSLPTALAEKADRSWAIVRVDAGGQVGEYTSLASDQEGNAAIAYFDRSNRHLKCARLNRATSQWDTEVVDGEGSCGYSPSLAFDGDGNPRISYWGGPHADLRYAWFADGAWHKATVDPEDGGFFVSTSLALDDQGNPGISYWGHGATLKYAHFDGSQWTIEDVDSEGEVGLHSSLAFNGRKPAISYYDKTNKDLKYAHFDGSEWIKERVDAEGDVGTYTSLAFSEDRPHITYHDVTNGDLKFASFNGSEWVIEKVDTEGSVGWGTSLAFDARGNPVVSYFDLRKQDLKCAHFDGTDWIIERVDTKGEVGIHNSLALDPDGNVGISYHDKTNQDLKFAYRDPWPPADTPESTPTRVLSLPTSEPTSEPTTPAEAERRTERPSPSASATPAAEEGARQAVALDLVPAGIEGRVQGSISLEIPPGYELAESSPKEGSWGGETITWTDNDYRGNRVLWTIAAPDGTQHSSLGEQIDGLYFGGGVLFIRGPADIRAEAEEYLRPHIKGTIYEEGTVSVPGDGASYPGYYYLSTHAEEHTFVTSKAGEKIEYEWTSVHHNLDVRVALSNSPPLYTVAFWCHTWGLPDRTDEHGRKHTYTIDGQPQLARHERYLKEILASMRVDGWKAPSPAPTEVETEITGSDWLDAIPLPTEISTEAKVISTNLGLALLFALAFGLTSALLNAALEENEEIIDARLAPLLAPIRRLAQRLPRLKGGRTARLARPVLLLLLSALLYAFLDPGFGVSSGGFAVLLSLFVSLAILAYTYDGIQALLGARFLKLRSRFELFPLALVMGVACVLATRWMKFHPGYLYGFVAGFTFLGRGPETPRSRALLVLAGVAVTLGASLAAWGLAVPVARLAEGGFPGASVLYGILVSVFVAGLEGLLFALVPLTFMDGSEVMAWSRAAWGVVFGLAAWLFFHVLINPGGAYLEAITGKKVLLMLGTLGVYGSFAVGTWLFFRWYARRQAESEGSA